MNDGYEALAKLDELASAATGHGGFMQAETVRNYVRRIRRAIAEILADDLPWSIILNRLEATVAKGQDIQRRALLDGLCKAARLMCLDCDRAHKGQLNVERSTIQGARWTHFLNPGPITSRPCNAGPIRDEITDMERVT